MQQVHKKKVEVFKTGKGDIASEVSNRYPNG